MHTYKLRPHRLNTRVPGYMLRTFPTRPGDHHGPIYLQRSPYTCSYTTGPYTGSIKTGRDSCRVRRIIAADPDKNGLGISDKNPSRMRERTCTHTQCDADVEAITHPSTHTYIHTYNTYTPGMFYVSLWPARELRAALVYCVRCLSWRFGCLHSSVLRI
jgi:hypothetical protein